MSEQVVQVMSQYRTAHAAAQRFNPGQQPDIAELMRSAYTHGYAQALLDIRAVIGGDWGMNASIAMERVLELVDPRPPCEHKPNLNKPSRCILCNEEIVVEKRGPSCGELFVPKVGNYSLQCELRRGHEGPHCAPSIAL